MRSTSFLAIVVLSACALGACQGSTSSAVSRAPECPDTLPPAGSPCTPPDGGFWPCEYGSNPHCTTTATCSASTPNFVYTWTLAGPDPSCSGNAAACPATFGAVANGAPCPVQGACTYDEGRCACSTCESTTPGAPLMGTEWECEAWATPAGCPEPRPLLGTSCSDEGQECDYGPACCETVDVDPAMTCTQGYWDWVHFGCDCEVERCGQ